MDVKSNENSPDPPTQINRAVEALSELASPDARALGSGLDLNEIKGVRGNRTLKKPKPKSCCD